MRSFDLEDLAIPEVCRDVVGHTVRRLDGLLVWIPHVVGNEFQDEFRISRPWQWAPGRRLAPSLKIGEVRGEGAEGVGTHAGIGEMLQGRDIGVRQDRGIAIGGRHRQHGRQSVELLFSPDLRCRIGQRCLSPRHVCSSGKTMVSAG